MGRSLTRRAGATAALVACSLSGCERRSSVPVRASEAFPGGETSVPFEPSPSFLLPASNLEPEGRPDFYAGRALSEQPWVKAPSSTDARDGLGPLYNARSCIACHIEGGRGRVEDRDGPLSLATLVRLSGSEVSPSSSSAKAAPEPTYGSQLQTRSVSLRNQLKALHPGGEEPSPRGEPPSSLPPEGAAQVSWKTHRYRYPDGAEVELRRPEVRLTRLAYGPLQPGTRVSLRHTPPLHGLGLLERIPQAELERVADPDDRDGNGISGRQNRVWDPVTKKIRPGRFGHKANQPTLLSQVAAALRNDVGITSSVYPEQPCTIAQSGCRRATAGAAPGEPEISDALLTLVVGFVSSIGVPVRRKPNHPLVRQGRSLFQQAGCSGCHVPHFVTAEDPDAPHLSRQSIWPYTDLLLHDLGKALDDGRPDFEATGSEWRTPPLWGVGLARAVRGDVGLLHDGRARTIEEAVLWHGGEARASRERFSQLPLSGRQALLAFVRSL